MRKNHTICEKSLDTPLKEEKKNHEVENQLLAKVISNKNKKRKVNTSTQSLLMGVVQIKRESTNGSLNCEGVPTDGCSQLYVGDIDIRFENVAESLISHNHEYEYLVTST